MDDKTRILTTIIKELYFSQNRGMAAKKLNGEDHVHFSNPYDYEAKVGDLVFCVGSGIHDWTVGFVDSIYENHHFVIKEIGTDRLCNVSNESFSKIKGLNYETLLLGNERKFRTKVLKAFGRGDEYWYRYGGVRFDKNHAVIIIREAFGGMRKSDDEESTPFEVEMKWDSRTSIKKILETMIEQGYGTKKFEHISKS